MIIKLLKQTYIPLIILGVIAFTTYSIFGGLLPTVLNANTTRIGSYTWTYYTFDTRLYLINLQNNFSTDILTMSITDIPLAPETYTGWDVSKYLQYIINVLIYIANWLVWILNMALFYPIKLVIYPVRIIYTLVGLNTSDFEFIKAVETLCRLNIPYIPYIQF